MNAAVLHTLGQPPRYEPFPEPTPAEGEVLVHVRAAALKPLDKARADGSHYTSMGTLPAVAGVDGAGRLDDGSRVVFAFPRAPFGGMAERTVAVRSRCLPIPDGVDDVTAAAVFNPGLSAWGSLAWRAQLAPGETVLVLGATGATGQLAIQTAKLLGAARVVAAGRNEEVLHRLPALGADAVIRLGGADEELAAAFAREAGSTGYQVILDYLWGHPTEVLLSVLTRKELSSATSRVRLVEVGESSGPTITLPAAALRSTRLEILGAGTGSAPAFETWMDAYHQLMARVARGELRLDVERVPLAEVEATWQRNANGRRIVFVP